jgi:hypothetical protein
MNRKTLQKCITELAKDKPRLDYVSGILETLMETLPEDIIAPVETPAPVRQTGTKPLVMKEYPDGFMPVVEIDEGELLTKQAAAMMKNIAPLQYE